MPTDSADDAATSLSLLDRARDRDSDAWRRLVHIYSPLVAHWCHRCGFAEHDTADVSQDVFHAVSQALARFDHRKPGAFRGWLRTITYNTIRNKVRKPVAVGEGGSTAHGHWQELPEHLPDDDEADARRELVRRALDCVRGDFKPATWQAFEAVMLEGQAVPDVAASLQLSPGAVFQARARVLQRLREELGESLDALLSRE